MDSVLQAHAGPGQSNRSPPRERGSVRGPVQPDGRDRRGLRGTSERVGETGDAARGEDDGRGQLHGAGPRREGPEEELPERQRSVRCSSRPGLRAESVSHLQLWSHAEHQTFLHLPYGGNLEIELYLHHTNVSIVYRPKSDNVDRVVVDQGVLVTPMDPQLEGRLTVDGSDLFMKKVLEADTGVFKVTDLTGFTVAHVYIEVERKRKVSATRVCSL